MSDSVRPHRWQPTRLPRLWDSPGKNTGVGCHFLLQCMKGKSESEVAQSCTTLRDPMDCSPPGSSVHGIFQARVLEWGAIELYLWRKNTEKLRQKIPPYWLQSHNSVYKVFKWCSFLFIYPYSSGSAPSISTAAFQTCRHHLFIFFTSTALVY